MRPQNAALSIALTLFAPTLLAPRPVSAAELEYYRDGSASDAQPPKPKQATLLLMGGGRDVDAAMRPWLRTVGAGDVVILRSSRRDGYHPYMRKLGAPDSVETLVIRSRKAANSALVQRVLKGADAVFIAGGDQARYLRAWRGSKVQSLLQAAVKRGCPIGGTSAGLAILGEHIFSAKNGGIQSSTALANPLHPRLTLASKLLDISVLKGFLTDSHFSERQRLGRLLSFLGRLQPSQITGLGIDEGTALLIRGSWGQVYGRGQVHVIRRTKPGPKLVLKTGQPLSLGGYQGQSLAAKQRLFMPEALSPSAKFFSLSVQAGALKQKPQTTPALPEWRLRGTPVSGQPWSFETKPNGNGDWREFRLYKNGHMVQRFSTLPNRFTGPKARPGTWTWVLCCVLKDGRVRLSAAQTVTVKKTSSPKRTQRSRSEPSVR